MNKLSTKHFIFFILGSSLITIKSYSSIFIKLGGRDTWLLFLVSALILSLLFILILKICRYKNIYDIQKAFSSSGFLGKVLLFIFSIGLFLSSIESASTLSSSIHTNYFLSTPIWYCLIFFLICTSYVLTKNINSILILILITITTTLAGDILLFALMIKYLDFSYLLPIMGDGLTYTKIIDILLMVSSLSSVCIILPYIKFLRGDKNKLIAHSNIGLIICYLSILSSIISAITFFGPIRASNIFYPEYIQSQRVQIAHFLEFGELFYIFKNTCMWFIKYILASYGILILFENSIKNKKIFIIIYSSIIFIASWLLTQNQYYFFDWLKLMQILFLITLLVAPLIGLLICKKNHLK